MIKVVPDTNVIISAVFWSGKPYRVISRGLKGEYQLITSPEIIGEVADKLRNKFGFPSDKVNEQVNILMALYHLVEPSAKVDVVRDKSDNKILECAVEGDAEFVVTGDLDLLAIKEFRGVKIVSAHDFLETRK